MTLKDSMQQYLDATRHWFGGKSGMFWLAETGQYMQQGKLPKGMRRGKMRQCYANAFRFAQMNRGDRWWYAEGYAISSEIPFPMEHAWMYDAQTGLAVDMTWKYEEVLYFGVLIPTDTLQRVVLHTKVFGVLCNFYRLPLDLKTEVMADIEATMLVGWKS